MTTLGNITLLDRLPVGFLCSAMTASSAILPCLDWANEMAKGDVPVMSTFRSKIENKVLEFLLRGKCPIILVLPKGIYRRIPEEYKKAIEEGRMLIVSPVSQSLTRVGKPASIQCNRYIAEQASSLVFGYIHPESSLMTIYQHSKVERKQVTLLTEHKS